MYFTCQYIIMCYDPSFDELKNLWLSVYNIIYDEALSAPFMITPVPLDRWC